MSAYRAVMLIGAAALAVVGGASLARRRARSAVVDWPLAGRVAHKLAGEPAPWRPDAGLSATYQAIVRRSFQAVGDYTGTPVSMDGDRFRVLGRAEWIDANLASFRRLLAPLAEAYQDTQANAGVLGRLVGTATGYGVSGQLGLLLGFLGRRVLGQYDVPLLEAGHTGAAMYFVEPNIRALAQRSGVDLPDLRLWVGLHESTHAFQFQAGDPPWLRAYTADLVRGYLSEAVRMVRRSRELRARLRESLNQIERPELRGAGILRLALTREQADLLERLQALMTLMEGYSNHVMRVAGERLIPNYAHLADRMRAREESRSAAFRLTSRLLGLDMKLEQYRIGEAFVTRVVETQGLACMNRVWAGPDNLPTLAETRDPDAWIARMEREGAK